jgi:hypothetical protein
VSGDALTSQTAQTRFSAGTATWLQAHTAAVAALAAAAIITVAAAGWRYHRAGRLASANSDLADCCESETVVQDHNASIVPINASA